MPEGKPRKGVPPSRLGSKARCDALLRIKNELDYADGDFGYCTWILVAGFSKESPTKATSPAQTSLAEDMCSYLSGGGRLYHFDPVSWGTYEETRAMIQEIRSRTPCGFTDDDEVYVSTNLGHMPRVRLCWFFLKPKGWKVSFVTAKHSFTFWPEWFQEIAKFFTYFYRFLFKKW